VILSQSGVASPPLQTDRRQRPDVGEKTGSMNKIVDLPPAAGAMMALPLTSGGSNERLSCGTGTAAAARPGKPC